MFCGYCGTEMKTDSFCPKCGKGQSQENQGASTTSEANSKTALAVGVIATICAVIIMLFIIGLFLVFRTSYTEISELTDSTQEVAVELIEETEPTEDTSTSQEVADELIEEKEPTEDTSTSGMVRNIEESSLFDFEANLVTRTLTLVHNDVTIEVPQLSIKESGDFIYGVYGSHVYFESRVDWRRQILVGLRDYISQGYDDFEDFSESHIESSLGFLSEMLMINDLYYRLHVGENFMIAVVHIRTEDELDMTSYLVVRQYQGMALITWVTDMILAEGHGVFDAFGITELYERGILVN